MDGPFDQRVERGVVDEDVAVVRRAAATADRVQLSLEDHRGGAAFRARQRCRLAPRIRRRVVDGVVGDRGLGVAAADHVDLPVQHDGRVAAPRGRKRSSGAPAACGRVVDADARDRSIRRAREAADDVDLPVDRNGRGRVQLAAGQGRLAPPALPVEAIDDRSARSAEDVDRVALDDDRVRRARVRKLRGLRPGTDRCDQEESDQHAHLVDGGHSRTWPPEVDENLCKLENQTPVGTIECVLRLLCSRCSSWPGPRPPPASASPWSAVHPS